MQKNASIFRAIRWLSYDENTLNHAVSSKTPYPPFSPKWRITLREHNAPPSLRPPFSAAPPLSAASNTAKPSGQSRQSAPALHHSSPFRAPARTEQSSPVSHPVSFAGH